MYMTQIVSYLKKGFVILSIRQRRTSWAQGEAQQVDKVMGFSCLYLSREEFKCFEIEILVVYKGFLGKREGMLKVLRNSYSWIVKA